MLVIQQDVQLKADQREHDAAGPVHGQVCRSASCWASMFGAGGEALLG